VFSDGTRILTRVLIGTRGSNPHFRMKSLSKVILYPRIQPCCPPDPPRTGKIFFPTFLTFSLLDVPYNSRGASVEKKRAKGAPWPNPAASNERADGITEAHDVHAHIAREQRSSRTPQQRDLSRAMPGSVNGSDAASDGQYCPRGQRLDDGNRVQSLLGMLEQVAQNLPQQTRCRRQRPKWTSALGHRGIKRMHVGPRTGFLRDHSGAANVIRVAVSEN